MNQSWYKIGQIAIFVFSFCIRFWGLDRYNLLVFDEVFYAEWGNKYLLGIPFYSTHPPVGIYMIAIGIWIGNKLPFSQKAFHGLTGMVQSPWSYRCANAFIGSFVPLIIISLTYRFSKRHLFALLAGFFTALDGFLIIESRYALNNIHTLFYGLLGYWLFFVAIDLKYSRRSLAMIGSGILLGTSLCAKWNALFFLLGIFGLKILGWIISFLQEDAPKLNQSLALNLPNFICPKNALYRNELKDKENPISKTTQINIFLLALSHIIIPFLTYFLLWIPYKMIDRDYDFIEINRENYHYHSKLIPPGPHPLSSRWYQWPLMLGRTRYYAELADSYLDEFPHYGPHKPWHIDRIHYVIHSFGNPFLWWFGSAAIIYIFGVLIRELVIPMIRSKYVFIEKKLKDDVWICLFLFLNYFANLLPWILINRYYFMYHYITAVVFKFISLAWCVDKCLESKKRWLRKLGFAIILIVIISFLYWLPVVLGLPMHGNDYVARMWFKIWF
jgi:dolichyl-phosphate-mannose-protein mannosyltransferase